MACLQWSRSTKLVISKICKPSLPPFRKPCAGHIMQLQGGCLCKQVRYSIQTKVSDPQSNYCHCRACQLATGSPVAAFFSVPEADVTWEGDVGVYRSSNIAVRKFCKQCGTPLLMYYTGEDAGARNIVELDICLTTLDNPDAISPKFHIWCESQRPWLKLTDNLPRKPRESNSA